MKYLVILLTLVLASCATPKAEPDLVRKYLAEANAGLSQGKHLVLEKVERRDTSLVTVIVSDATTMSVEELRKAKKTAEQDIQQVVLEYCKRNRPYADLETQGYIFKIEMTFISPDETKTAIKPLSQQTCNASDD